MWRVSARDLQFRARRFVIAVVVTSLVFGVALAIDGMRRAVQAEAPKVVAMFGADRWFVATGTTGPFTSTRVVAASIADELRRTSGVRRADPVVLSGSVINTRPMKNVNLVGVVTGGLGSPPISQGRAATHPGEAVLSPGTSVKIGDRLLIGGIPFRVVGKTDSGRYDFGMPAAFVPLRDAQQLVFNGQPLAMAIAVRGTAASTPPGTVALTNAQVTQDLGRPVQAGVQSIVVTAVLMWLIAAGIIGLIVYLSAIERTRDFAVFKATGAPNRIIVGGLMLQAVIVAVVAALLAIGVSGFVAQALPLKGSLNAAAVLQLLVISIAVGVLSSLAGVRRALGTDPAVAFGGI
jgi:putative ABC transport system permease protein